MNDTISRKDALNEVQRFLGYIDQDMIDRIKVAIGRLPSAQQDFDITAKIDKAYDDGYEAGYLQGRHDWGDLDE